MKVHFIYHRIGHHSEHSGYDQIVKYIPHKEIGSQWSRKLTGRLVSRWQEKLLKDVPLIWYSKERLTAEFDVMIPFLTTAGHVYHYLYGEDLYYYLSKLPNWGKNRIVVSYHQPPSFFPKAVLTTDHVKRADAIITVSKKQKEFFSEIVGEERVFFVPHGVDTEFFHPLNPPSSKEAISHPPLEKGGKGGFDQGSSDKPKRCLFVGQWLRDIDMLSKVISIFQSRGIDSIHFTVVTHKKYFEKFKDLKYVELLSEVPAEVLLKLYQTSDLLFLPLLDCTANNTILEAMACGLPIVTTAVGGVWDYLDEKSAVLLPQGDADAAVEVLSDLLRNSERLSDLSLQGRQRAVEFGWPIVAGKMMDVYEKVLEE